MFAEFEVFLTYSILYVLIELEYFSLIFILPILRLDSLLSSLNRSQCCIPSHCLLCVILLPAHG